VPKLTVVYGVALIALGLYGYFGSGQASVTALIPAFFGLPIAIAGLLAARENLRKHAMHAAAALALLGTIGAARGIPGLVKILGGEEVERPIAVASQSILFFLSLIFVLLCVRSFMLARKSQAGGAG